MVLFVTFIIGGVILGAGTMLAPAWPTRQPRIALTGTLSLALIVGGTIFYASLFGWDTLVIDYLLFALVVGIFLSGALSVGQARAETRGEELLDADQGWPGPQDLAFFGVIGLALLIPALVLPVPMGESGLRYAYVGLTTQLGETFDTLSPFQPDIHYLYSPAYNALTAYLNHQLEADMHQVQLAVGAVLAFMCVWLAYDLGAELSDKRLGRAMALTMLLSLGMPGMYVNAHYPALMGLLFAMAFVLYTVRYTRHHYPVDAVGAGLMLGAVAITHPGMTIIVGLGYVPWLATMWLGTPRPDGRTWAVLAMGIPLIALAAISPWLVNVRDALGAGYELPFARTVDHITVLLTYHGVWVIGAVVLALWVGWARRDSVVILCAGWLLLFFDFAVSGGVATLFPFVTQYVDPLGIAWHGPVIPFTILGGMGALWLWDAYVVPRGFGLTYQQTYVVAGGLAAVIAIVAILNAQVLAVSKSLIDWDGAYAAEADIAVADWLHENTPAEGTRILNFYDSRAGCWTPLIAERDAVYFPALPFAQQDEAFADSLREQDTLRDFWLDPAAPANAELLRAAGITHVVVPQVLGNPDSIDDMWRWADAPQWTPDSSIADAPFLEPVFTRDGAAVYVVVTESNE